MFQCSVTINVRQTSLRLPGCPLHPFPPSRKGQHKRRAFVRLAFHIHLAFVGGHNGLHITEAEAKAFNVVDIARRDAIKLVKDQFPGILADAYALIRDGHFYA